MNVRMSTIGTTLFVAWAMTLLTACGSGEDAGGPIPAAVPSSGAAASLSPGGFVEPAGSAVRSRWTATQLQEFLPKERGKFSFPAPYHTEAVRLTSGADCGGADCVWSVGYSYWRNTNNHVGSDRMLIFLALDPARGGTGPTLLSYDKTTDQVTKLGPLFERSHRMANASATGWYFSATLPTRLYLNDGPRMVRYDVLTKDWEVVFDLSSQFGADREVWQMSSSNDDLVHAATLRVKSSGAYLGCVVYLEATKQFRYYAKVGGFDECHIDRSGQYLLILEQLDGQHGLDNRYIHLQTGVEERLLNLPGIGSVGHYDLGYGYVVGTDSFGTLPNAAVAWAIEPMLRRRGPVEHRAYDWNVGYVNHLSHTNAKPGLPMERQYACGSNADRSYAQNELLCFRMDGSLEHLVVAPLMANLDTSGGRDSYDRMPKGNLDVTGQYFIWTANLGTTRLDAFIVKVPGHLLIGS